MDIEARRRRWARVMAIVGAVLVWLPIARRWCWARPCGSGGGGCWWTLMPAELFPLILAGGACC